LRAVLTPVHVWHDIVQALVRPLPARRLALADAECCVLARAVQTLHPLPPFDASAMDGYAVRARDVLAAGPAHPVRLRVIASAPAGHPVGAVVGAGDAVRILTGGQLPAGSDAVVAVESTDGGRDVVQVREPVGPGRHVRRAGEDLTQGAHVLEPGRVVGPGQAAAAAAAGHTALLVVPRPRVVIVSTGDELVAPGQLLAPGDLPDSNSVGLAAAVRLAGGQATVARCGDDPRLLRRLLAKAAGAADLVVTSGGISAGEENDVVKAALSGGSVRFVNVAMQPGSPQAAGTLDGVAFVGLPGNPVSALVSFAVFALPLVRTMRGLSPVPPVRRVELAAPVDPHPLKTRFVSARWASDGDRRRAVPHLRQGSHLMAALADTDLLLEIAPGTRGYAAGSLVPARFLNDTEQ